MTADQDRAVLEAVAYAGALGRALEVGGSPDAREEGGRSALEVAIESDNLAALEQLIRAGADVNTAGVDGWTPLHTTADHEGDTYHQNNLPMDLRFVRPLLDAGANPAAVWNDRGRTRTPIDIARDYGHTAAVAAMVEALGRHDGGAAPTVP